MTGAWWLRIRVLAGFVLLLTALWGALWGAVAQAADLVAVRHEVQQTDARLAIVIGLDEAGPYRVFTRTDPARLVVDMQDMDLAPAALAALQQALAPMKVRAGRIEAGWGRLVIALDAPYALTHAQLQRTPAPGLRLTLENRGPDYFAQTSRNDDKAASAPAPLRIALDAGHGGIDPGALAENGAVREKDLTFAFVMEMKKAFEAEPDFDVLLTRRTDIFVMLGERVRRAREGGADLMLSFHADKIPQPDFSGVTLFTLSKEASDKTAARYAAFENRADMLAGLDLTVEKEDVAQILVEMARPETDRRTVALAAALQTGLRAKLGAGAVQDRRSADFMVLRAPDMPSVLVELGFLSSAKDRARLADPVWRAQTIAGLIDGLRQWKSEDETLRRALRR